MRPLAVFIFLATFASGLPAKNPIVFPSLNSNPPERSLENCYKKAAKAVHNAAASLLELAKNDMPQNWVVSPLSLSSVFGQLMLGAKGDLRRTLGEILSPGIYPGLDVHREIGGLLKVLQYNGVADYILNVKNALFVEPKVTLKPSYKHALLDIYNVQTIPANFSGDPVQTLVEINEWVRKESNEKIKKLLSKPPTSSTASIYVNTVYFRGNWIFPFDPILTKPGVFSVSNNQKVVVDYMSGEVEVTYLEEEACNCTMIGIPYKESQVMFYIFMPHEKSMGDHFKIFDFASKFSLDHISYMVKKAEKENMTVSLPKFKLTTTMNLQNSIIAAVNQRKKVIRRFMDFYSMSKSKENYIDGQKQMNLLSNRMDQMPSMKSEKSTLTMESATDDSQFQISEIFHQVNVDVNEIGSEVVGATATVVDYYAASRILRINRPFMFLIRHEKTETHLFWGCVTSPVYET